MKILVIQQKMIGDVLTSSIMFEALRIKYPKAQLDYLINEHTIPVVENNPFINKIIVFSPEIEKSKFKLYTFLKSIRKERYHIVIDVYSKFSSNLVALFSGAKIKISKYKWYTSTIYSHTLKAAKYPKTNAGLAIENRLQLLNPIISGKIPIYKPKIYLTVQEIKNSKSFLEENGINLAKPLFMISVLGSSFNKTYPLNYMSKLLDTIINKTQGQILFNYIPSQKKEVNDLFNLCKTETQENIFLDIFGKSLREFMGLTMHCDALIGNEGGAINMAKALDIPTFAIFSPWIKKEAWNMFDDDKKHVSVHLNDFKPEFYTNTPYKTIRKNAHQYYKHFIPEYILPDLLDFI